MMGQDAARSRHRPQFLSPGAHFRVGKLRLCPIALWAGWGEINHSPVPAVLCLPRCHPQGFKPMSQPSPPQSN